MFEMPTGSYDRGLGVGKAYYKIPLWLQKNEGKWLFDGGGLDTKLFPKPITGTLFAAGFS
jgi:hypothetical protein